MHSISNHTQFYRNLDYSLYREVLSRKGEMGGARDREKNQVYNKLKLAKSLLTNPLNRLLFPLTNRCFCT